MAVDSAIVSVVADYLAGRSIPPTPITSGPGRAGVRFDLSAEVDYINTRPGGLTLYMHGKVKPYPATPVLVLDRGFDLIDETTDMLRDSIVEALESAEMPFLPVSWQPLHNAAALDSGRTTWHDLELIDRDGLQCVFRLAERRYYISGFDRNEEPPLYFMARLPHAVNTFAEAIESLKPRSVKLAEAQGLRVLRQGDMFAIPTDYGDDDLAVLGATFGRELVRRRPRFRMSVFAEVLNFTESEPVQVDTVEDRHTRGLYGTAHTATELAHLPDGTMFARGRMFHDPRGVLREPRAPDHAPLELPGSRWFLIAKNTVPTTQGGR